MIAKCAVHLQQCQTVKIFSVKGTTAPTLPKKLNDWCGVDGMKNAFCFNCKR